MWGVLPSAPHPALVIIFLPPFQPFCTETVLMGQLSPGPSPAAPQRADLRWGRWAPTSYLSDSSFSLWGISLGRCRGTSVSCGM